MLIRNLKSKFGTLILLKRPLVIKNKKIDLQVGRTFIEANLFSMKEFEMLKKEKNKKIERELSKSLQIKQSIERENNINEKNLNNKNKRRRDK